MLPNLLLGISKVDGLFMIFNLIVENSFESNGKSYAN